MSATTIIIVNWNSWDYLFPCLDAISQQTFQDFDLLVVDNNSSDQTPATLLQKYPRLTFIQNSTNKGFAAANNQAIQSLKECEWVVLLNPDTLPEKNWLERLHKAAVSRPEFSFFGSCLIMADSPDKLDGTGDVYHMSGLSWRAGHGGDVSSVADAPVEIFSPCAAAAMYRLEELLAIGGFDEDFFCYNEDVDLGFRLRLAGHRALFVPDSIVLHHGSATTSVRSDFSVYHGHRNLVWTWLKNMPTVLLWIFFPVHVVYAVACIALYIKRGQGNVILRAKWDAIKGVRCMWRKRKTIHTNSRLSLKGLWRIINKSLIVGPGNKHNSK